MSVAFPKRRLPFALAAISFVIAALCLSLFLTGSASESAWGAAGFALGSAAFLVLGRLPVLRLRDGMLLTGGIAVPLASIRAARIVRFWFGGGPTRLLELHLSEMPDLSRHARLFQRFSPWRLRFVGGSSGYTPPPEPYLALPLPETDLSDEDIVDLLHLPRKT